MSDRAGLFPEDDRCPACGLDPCGCGVDLPGSDDPDVDFREIEAVAAIVRATPIAATRPAELLAPWSSPAFAAFIDRRDDLRERHGDKAVTDPTRTPSALAHDLKERSCAVLDRLSGHEPDAERATLALNTLATIGGIVLTLHERLSAYVRDANRPALGGEEGGPGASTTGESSGSIGSAGEARR